MKAGDLNSSMMNLDKCKRRKMEKILTDFHNDVICKMRERLIESGYSKNDVMNVDDRELPYRYFLICKKFIKTMPRKLYKSKEFECPDKYIESVEMIETAITQGHSLIPFLSDRIKDFNNEQDVLLKNWDIYHFHLGKKKKSNGFVKRTNELLFCCFKNENAYLINIFHHKSFTDKKLIQIIHNNWPEILIKLDGLTPGPESYDIDILKAIYRNISLAIAIENNFYLPTALALTFSGHSLRIQMYENRFFYTICMVTESYSKGDMSETDFENAKSAILASL